MLRRLIDGIRWQFRTHAGPGQELYYLYQLTRRAMRNDSDLSINPGGVWSPRKAAKVLDIIAPQAALHGIVFSQLDVTNFNHPGRRIMLVPYCIEHDIAIHPDSVCAECVRHAKKDKHA